MKNWKTTIGGAFTAFGTALMGVGVITQLNGPSSKLIQIITIIGFIFTAVGQFFSHLFAADAGQVKDIAQQVETIKEQQASNTDFITKQQVNNPQQKV